MLSPPTKRQLIDLAKSSVAHVSVALAAEESETYPRIIARLNDHWRVVACRNGIQWILQVRHGQGWRNRYFYRTRAGLFSGSHEYAGEIRGDGRGWR
jgi:hypothetical protein